MSHALESLALGLQRLDVPLWRPPGSLQPLVELQETVSPLELADDLVTFWSEVDVATLRVGPYPGFTDPASARETWVRRRDELSDIEPVALVDIGYDSQAVLSSELTIGDRPGGAVFAWWADDLIFYRCFDGLGDWIAVISWLIEQGAHDPIDRHADTPWLSVPTEQEWSPDPALTAHYHLPVGVSEVVDYDGADAWPPHWRDVQPDR